MVCVRSLLSCIYHISSYLYHLFHSFLLAPLSSCWFGYGIFCNKQTQNWLSRSDCILELYDSGWLVGCTNSTTVLNMSVEIVLLNALLRPNILLFPQTQLNHYSLYTTPVHIHLFFSLLFLLYQILLLTKENNLHFLFFFSSIVFKCW